LLKTYSASQFYKVKKRQSSEYQKAELSYSNIQFGVFTYYKLRKEAKAIKPISIEFMNKNKNLISSFEVLQLNALAA
jgi:hypothetical protein